MESGAMMSGTVLEDEYMMRFSFRLYRVCVCVLWLGSGVLSSRMMPESSDALEVDCVTDVMKKLVTTALAARPVMAAMALATAPVDNGLTAWSICNPSARACPKVPGM
ncbi:hypothetical protein D3C71_1830620 [compost metagenome]